MALTTNLLKTEAKTPSKVPSISISLLISPSSSSSQITKNHIFSLYNWAHERCRYQGVPTMVWGFAQNRNVSEVSFQFWRGSIRNKGQNSVPKGFRWNKSVSLSFSREIAVLFEIRTSLPNLTCSSSKYIIKEVVNQQIKSRSAGSDLLKRKRKRKENLPGDADLL